MGSKSRQARLTLIRKLPKKNDIYTRENFMKSGGQEEQEDNEVKALQGRINRRIYMSMHTGEVEVGVY